MAAYQKGNVDAFSQLMGRFEKPLWNYVRRFVKDGATAEDVLQEAFMRVLRGAADWRPEARFSTWIYTIARNLCTDHARRMDLRRADSLEGPVGGDSEGSGPKRIDRVVGRDRGGEAAVIDAERAARIEAAVAILPPDLREVFVMREVMELPFAEIAKLVGAPEPTIKSRMRYALERLRTSLKDLRDSGSFPAVAVGESP